MAINTKKVLLGGVVAGIVLNVIDFLVNGFLLKDRMNAEMEAFKPGTAAAMSASSAMYSYIIIDLILGIALVWTYAAIRPRFGPGARTSAFAAILFWVLLSIGYYGFMGMGMMSAGLWWTFGVIGLVNLLIAAWIGARLYTEDGPAV